MFRRSINISKSYSFFLFGARGVGKSHLLKKIFAEENTLWIDLLTSQNETYYTEDPDRLSETISKLRPRWVVIDEVQKIPKLLDIVHHQIESGSVKFALTGSSARKLKRGAANLLAGRAFVYHLFPLSVIELGENFDLMKVLQWGSLPGLFQFKNDEEKQLFLTNYVDTYLKEEVFAEQLVRGLVPFRKFLKIASQTNGQILNYSKISKDIGVDSKTVQTYFEILEDTLLGFYLPADDESFRKQQLKAPKFYLFDVGVKRAIEGIHAYPIHSSQELGREFEHWYLTEIFRLNSYAKNKYQLSYLHTKGGLEIDLILRHPREKTIFLEIKSTKSVMDHHLKHLQKLKEDFSDMRFICVSQEPVGRIKDGIEILPWNLALKELGLIPTDFTL